MNPTTKNPAAVALGRLGGAAKSAAKAEAARANAKKPRGKRKTTIQPLKP
jgi:hypothetical protein